MPKRVARFLLPFAVSAEDRRKAFTKGMEMAAVLCLAELERARGGGLILKRPAEHLVFIAEVCYPMWLIPWKMRTLLLDGFGIMMYTLSYDTLPDIEAFVNDIQGSAETREAYSAALSDSINYFQGFTGKEEKTIEGLVATHDFIQDFVSYLPKAKAIKKPIIDKVLLSPIIDESTILSLMQELSNIRAALKADTKRLHKSMKLLNTTTRKHVKVIHKSIREIQREFDEKIAAAKPSIMERVRDIQKKYDQKIIEASKKIEQQTQRLRQELVKLEKIRQHLIVKINGCEAEIQSCRLRRDEISEAQWRQELENSKKELSAIEKPIKDLDRKIEDADAAKRLMISKLRSEYDVQAEEVMEDLRALEAARDARIQMNRQEMESLENLTSMIVDKINKLVKLKRAAFNKLDGVGIKKRRRKHALVYIPFYLACFQAESKKRYVLYPPSFAGSLGVLVRFKGVFGEAKMKSLLQLRSKPIASLLHRLPTIIERNPVFEKEISDAGTRANILREKDSCQRIRGGLEKLRSEEWISRSEFQTLSELLTKA